MSDETLIDRVTRRVERRIEAEGYDGPDRRGKAPHSPAEALKWLPLMVVAITATVGYGALQQRVTALEKQMDKADETHAALWRRISE